MRHVRRMQEIVKKDPKDAFFPWLLLLRELFTGYLDGSVTADEVSDATAVWHFSDFSRELLTIDPRAERLKDALIISHCRYPEEKRKEDVKALLRLVDRLIVSV
ncbi:MAG: hypothetical protein ABIJ21_00710 [Nanoarchaeota archaeon]